MKSIIAIIASVFVSAPAFAGLECSISSGPGSTTVQVLSQGEFTTRYNGDSITYVYHCGAFVNDGTIKVDDSTVLTEIAADSCAVLPVGSTNDVIYCRP